MVESQLDGLHMPQRTLLGPGPSSVHSRVLRAMTEPVIGFLDPAFLQVTDEVCSMLRQVYHTGNPTTFPVSATGTGAMETACVNVLEPGDTAIVCRNGFFGNRFAEIAGRCGADVYTVDSPWGSPVDPAALEQELKKHSRVKAVGLVAGETSTGVLTLLPDIVDLVHRHDALVIVDAVTSLGGHDMRMDDWGIDVCYSGSQKCLGAPPGLAPISVGPRALEAINNRSSKVSSFYFSLAELDNYWSEQRVYHHTAPISMIYALREALRMMAEEGLQNRIDRHAKVAAALRAGLDALGIQILAEPKHRLAPLTAALIPDGIDDVVVRRRLLEAYNIEIGGGLGDLRGKVWRIGLMGESAREANVFALLSALETILPSLGYEVASGASLAAAQRALTTHAASP